MAEFTDEDKELLDKLRKAFEKTGKTRDELEPWEEHLTRDASVSAERAVLSAKVIEGFSGSWAAQYNVGIGSTTTNSGNPAIRALWEPDPLGPPVPVRAKESKIGQRGLPEIGFAPYNWRTHTFGSKGPSLIGHPISFEVVGPTLKSPATDWTWEVQLGTGIGGGDKLVMDVRPDGNPNVMEPYGGDITLAYGPFIGNGWTIGDPDEPNGGLYVIISDNGSNPGSVPAGRVGMGALPQYEDSARFEVFRIAQIPDVEVGVEYEIHLHPSKRLATYFDVTGDPNLSVRGITILKPYVTRMQAVPQSGAAGGNDGTSTSGREQTFVVLSPERAATPDTYPPFDGGTPGDGTWMQGGFTEARAPGSSAAVGSALVYGGKSRLPVPKPVLEIVGDVYGNALFPTDPVGEWFLSSASLLWITAPFSPINLPIAHIYSTSRDDDLPDYTFGSVENAIGWFDVIGREDNGRTGVTLRRVPETDPVTGLTYFGPGPYIQSGVVPLPNSRCNMTLHRAVSNLFDANYDIDGVEASRLKNLIDPHWVSRAQKQLSDPLLSGSMALVPGGGSAAQSDRAIFDTRSFDPPGGGLREAANPGNLMDLGFRMVVYPAKLDPAGSGLTVPDFDRPIMGRELVIDGSINEKQYIEIDYSAGIVRLSHPPPTSSGTVPDQQTDVIPNGISGTNNPREEVVLYAACVPYSMEDSQTGTGPRVTTHMGKDGRDFDVSSEYAIANIDTTNTTFSGVSPFIGPSTIAPNPAEIILDRLWDGPETGVITINSGNDDSPPFGRFGYSSTRTVSTFLGTVTALQDITAVPLATDPDPSLSAPDDPRSVILRREAVFSFEGLSLPAITDSFTNDTTFGSQLRANTLRFEDCISRYNLDGSVTIVPRSPGYTWNQHGSWMPSGTLDTTSGDDRIDAQGILAGVFYQDQTGTDVASTGSTLVVPQARDGQNITFSTLSGVGDFSGAVSRKSLITLTQGFRLVTKFLFVADASPSINGFIGLVGGQDASTPPPFTSIVQRPLLSPPDPTWSMLGIRVEGAVPAATMDFFTQNRLNPGSLARTTGQPAISVTDRPYYLVIENTPFRDATLVGGSGSYVKMALFDADFNELSSTRFYNQEQVAANDQLEFTFGSSNPGGGGANSIRFYSAVIVNRIELPFKAIP